MSSPSNCAYHGGSSTVPVEADTADQRSTTCDAAGSWDHHHRPRRDGRARGGGLARASERWSRRDAPVEREHGHRERAVTRYAMVVDAP